MNQDISFANINECENQISQWMKEAQGDLANSKAIHSSTQKVLAIAKASLLAGALLALLTPRYAHCFNVKRREAWKISFVLMTAGATLTLFNLKELQASYLQQDPESAKSLKHRIRCLKLLKKGKVSEAIENLRKHPEWITTDKGLEVLDQFANKQYNALYSIKSLTQNAQSPQSAYRAMDYVAKLLCRICKIALPI